MAYKKRVIRKFKQLLTSHSLIKSISIRIFLIILTSSILIMSLFYIKFVAYNKERFINNSFQIINHKKLHVDNILKTITTYFNLITRSPNFIKLVSSWDGENILNNNEYTNVSNLMESILRSNRYIHSIVYINKDNYSISVPRYRFNKLKESDLYSEKISNEVWDNEGEFILYPPSSDNIFSKSNKLLTIAHSLRGKVYKRKEGYLLINIFPDVINEILDENIFGIDGYFYIINSDGFIISHPNYSKIGSKLEAINILNKIKSNELTDFEYNFFSIIHKNKKKSELIIHSKSTQANWYFLSIIDELELTKSSKSIVLIIVMIQIVLLCITLLFVYNFLKRNLNPLKIINSQMLKFQGGDHTVRVENKFLYEFDSQRVSFNAMADQIENDFKKIEQQIMLIKEMRLKEKASSDEVLKIKKYLANILNSMPSFIISIDNKYIITQWNKFGETYTGLKTSEMIGNNIFNIIPELKPYKVIIEKSLKEKIIQTKDNIQTISNDILTYWNLAIYPLLDGENNGVVIRIDDNTEHVKLQNLMIQSEKMLSIGVLSAGVAHEINNPLAGIIQSIQVIKNRFSSSIPRNIEIASEIGLNLRVMNEYINRREIDRIMDNIETSGRKSAFIVKNMLNFSRRSKGKFVDLSIIKLIDNSIYLAENDYNLNSKFDFKNINIVKNYKDNIPLITGEATELEQVFLNILKNGAYAMSTSGIKDPTFIINIYANKTSIVLEISDNGPGIKDDLLSKIFEPFFTTKDVGSGTGLGMAVSYFIITDHHNGKIEVENIETGGALFRITLPIKDIL